MSLAQKCFETKKGKLKGCRCKNRFHSSIRLLVEFPITISVNNLS